MKHILKQLLIFGISVFLVYIMVTSILSSYREGFSVNDIDSMFDDVKQVTRVVGDIPDSINNVNQKLTQQVDNMGNQIERKTQQMGDEIQRKTEELGKRIEKNAEQMGNDIWNRTNQLGSQIEQGAKQMGNEIERKTEQMGNEIVKKTEEMGKEIEKKTVTFVTEKLKSVFIQLGDIFNKGLVMPILAVFTGIGDIFIQVFNIIKEIGNKIVSLPSCIFVYGIKEAIDTYFFLYDKLLPRFIRDIFGFFYRYVFRFIFDFIAYITGYDTSVRKCYGFNVSSEVDGINGSLNNIQSTFKKDFGRMDFSKINI